MACCYLAGHRIVLTMLPFWEVVFLFCAQLVDFRLYDPLVKISGLQEYSKIQE